MPQHGLCRKRGLGSGGGSQGLHRCRQDSPDACMRLRHHRLTSPGVGQEAGDSLVRLGVAVVKRFIHEKSVFRGEGNKQSC